MSRAVSIGLNRPKNQPFQSGRCLLESAAVCGLVGVIPRIQRIDLLGNVWREGFNQSAVLKNDAVVMTMPAPVAMDVSRFVLLVKAGGCVAHTYAQLSAVRMSAQAPDYG